VVDRTVEGWWRLAPRARLAVGAVVAGSLVLLVLGRVAASPYGPPVGVMLATQDLAAGTRPGAADLTLARWPRDLVPPGALRSTTELDGRRLAVQVTAGSPLVATHLRDVGVTHDLAPWAVAVAVSPDDLPGAEQGVTVDLIATLGDGTGRRLAAGVRVLRVEDGLAWLEVERSAAPDVAASAARGTLVAVLLPP
jgi:Flp pilus assembly protein CpaB